MINSLIINTLKPLNVPVRFHALLNKDGDPDTYITFFEYNQNGALHGDDSEIKTRHSIQVDIWSKGDYSNLTNDVRNRLINVGFTRNMETEFYEADTETYHKVLRFYFVQ